MEAAASRLGNLQQVTTTSKLVLTCHDRSAVVQPRLRRAWSFMAKWFFVNGFASAMDATRCSGSVRTVIADSAIAVPPAAPKPGSSSAAAPTAVTSGVPEGRLDHRDRQREYRRRCRAGVTDQGSHSISSPATSDCGTSGSGPSNGSSPLAHGFRGLAASGRPARSCAVSSVAGAAVSSIPSHQFHASEERADDQSRNPRTDSPLLLRRALENRHHRTRT